MNIKKTGNNSLAITSENKCKFDISVDESGYFEVKSGNETIIFSPGEYEYSHVHFIGLEQTESKYVGKINILNIVDGSGDSYLFISNVTEIKKDLIDKLANIDAVVVPLRKENNLINFLKKTSPYYVIFLDEFLFADSDPKTREYIEKQFKREANNKDNTVNVKNINTESEEDQITLTYII